MMKIYHKKSINPEDETVLVQLERRHTLKEGSNEEDLEDKSKKTSRTISLGNYEESCSSTENVASGSKKGNFTRRPTVITESELSSSWLYKDRKAKINSDDESVEDPKPNMTTEDESLEPRALQDPNLRPVPVPNQRPAKRSSCCFYFTMILVIIVASLAIVAGVAGVIYMELFSYSDNPDVADTDQVVNDDKNTSAFLENFQLPIHEDNLTQKDQKMLENILKDLISNSTFKVPDIALHEEVTTLNPKGNIFDKEDQIDSNHSKKKYISEMPSGFVSEDQHIEMSENSIVEQFAKFSRNMRDRLNQINLNDSNKSVKMDTKVGEPELFDLKPNNTSIESNSEKKSDELINEENRQNFDNKVDIVSEISNPETEVPGSSEQSFISVENFNSDETTLQYLETNNENVSSNESFQNVSKLKDLEHLINHDHNSFEHNETSIDDSNRSFEADSQKDGEDQNFNDSAQLVFIRPVVESKAVPVPLSFLRRIGFDIKNPNSHQPMTAEDMDIKFSLSEALKYLRSLDAGNKLPTSREKTIAKMNKELSMNQKLPNESENREYLNILRKRLFQKS